jgi:hypothetical protein
MAQEKCQKKKKKKRKKKKKKTFHTSGMYLEGKLMSELKAFGGMMAEGKR